MKIRQIGGQRVLDFRWPDKIRSRYYRDSQKEADSLMTRVKSAILDNTWKALRQSLTEDSYGPVLCVKDLLSIYKRDYVEVQNRGIKPTLCRIKHLSKAFGSLPASSITVQCVMAYSAKRQKKDKVKNITINKEFAVLRNMTEWAKKLGYLAVNPLSELTDLSTQEWAGQRPTESILDTVFSHLRADVLPLFTFMRETGCRREEALSLRHDQVDLESAEVRFSGNTKSGKARWVPLTETAIKAISSMPRSPKTDYVFYSSDGAGRWSDCRKPWEEARTKAGYEWLRVQDIRKAYGIRLAESGECTMHDIQTMLGHHSVTVTEEFYAQFLPKSGRFRVLRGMAGGKVGSKVGSEKISEEVA